MKRRAVYTAVILLIGLIFGALFQPLRGAQTFAQSACRSFPETGKEVCGRFLEYWESHGGLAQQGFPISQEMQERSDTDGRMYTVQYFERAVFEMHPENQPPNDVLLSLLGVFRYKQKYPASGGAPRQTTSNAPDARLFSETGHRVGGKFLEYWNSHGGLAQQGLPISDEFTETSDLNGKEYRVQYFERAVFEMHPENQPPNDVLLSQLGTVRYREKYLRPSPTPVVSTPVSLPSPTAISSPTAAATAVPLTSCEGIPPNIDMHISPSCAPLWSTFRLYGTNFEDQTVGVYATTPSGKVFGAPFHAPVSRMGNVREILFVATPDLLEPELGGLDPRDIYGIWTVTMEGTSTHKKSYGYFKLIPVVPTPTPTP